MDRTSHHATYGCLLTGRWLLGRHARPREPPARRWGRRPGRHGGDRALADHATQPLPDIVVSPPRLARTGWRHKLPTQAASPAVRRPGRLV